jgi:hypothetical protein
VADGTRSSFAGRPLAGPTGDAEVSLDLQTAFETVYDLGGFDLVVDHCMAPPVPMQDEQAA